MSSAHTVPVTLAEIARIAGVGRAAVSNWRRRHASFPSRIGGTDVSPQFSLTEAEEWLRMNGKLANVGGRELLWPRFEALGSRDETGLAIAESARRMRTPRAQKGPEGMSAEARELAAEAARLGRREGARDTFEFLLQRWLETHVRQISITPPPLAALMARIAMNSRTGADEAVGLTVFDPACGTGHLLAAAALAHDGPNLTLQGCEREPALAALAAARLAFATDERSVRTEIHTGDALREAPSPRPRADIALCNPPFNERDWGYEELATDPRWTHGLPPRTEPELAWVQHLLANLRPGGTAVVVLPPAVASRKAGRRIRGSLLRTGLLRAVVALPPGCAQPHSVSLQLWLLRSITDHSAEPGPKEVLLVDAARLGKSGAGEPGPDWAALSDFVLGALGTLDTPNRELPDGAARVPPLDLLDDEVDVTPGRYTASGTDPTGIELLERWRELTEAFASLGELTQTLSALTLEGGGGRPTAAVGDLIKAGALTMRAGQQPADATAVLRVVHEEATPFLTVPDVLTGSAPSSWLAPGMVQTTVEEGDVVVAGVVRAFSAWVHQGPPTALGPQLYALRVAPDRIDAHFLAGCLRAPANGRRAGTHASTSSRVDIRRLQVLQLPLAEQSRYSEAFRRVTRFEQLLDRAGTLGQTLSSDLGDRLAAGGLGTGSP